MPVFATLKVLAVVGFLLIFSSLSHATNERAEDSILTPDQVERDVALAREAYTRIHPGYSRYTAQEDLLSAWQGVIDEAARNQGMSLGDFYIHSSRVLAQIRCDHTKAELPKSIADTRKTHPVYLPMRWELIKGRGFVSIPGEGTGLERGDELLAIDGQALSDRVNAVLPLIPYDGKTEWARNHQAAQSYEFRGGGVDHFGALMFDTHSSAELTIRRGDSEPMTIQVERITYPQWLALGAGQSGARNFKDAVSFERIGENAAYLKVDTFVNYREPVKPDKLYDPIFRTINKEGRDTLIVDLRENGGGSDDASQRLLAHLITKAAAFKKDIRVKTLDMSGLEAYLSTWDRSAINPNPAGFIENADGSYSLRPKLDTALKAIKPDRTAFAGRLILLTSSQNSSGSTHLLAFIKAQNPNVLLIGERTGGSAEGATAGILFTLTLPESGIRMRVPAMRSFINIEKFEPGFGVSPDIEAPKTIEDFLAGRDAALEKAIEIATTSQGTDSMMTSQAGY